MKKLLIAALLLTGCVTGDDEASSTLRKSGYTNVRPGSLDFFECSDNDKTGRSFRATNSLGQEVEGVVCCGVFKGCTVRF